MEAVFILPCSSISHSVSLSGLWSNRGLEHCPVSEVHTGRRAGGEVGKNMLALVFTKIGVVIAIILRQSHCLPESFKGMGEGIK